METNIISVPVQIVIGLLGVMCSGLAVYVGIKVALAESKKDIMHITKEVEKLDVRIQKHIDSPTHPTGEQVNYLARSLDDFKDRVEDAHERIEKKVDTVMDVLLKNTNNR